MSTSENIIQLKQAGDGITLRVTKCEKMKIGTYPEVEFTGVDATGRECIVRVPEKSSDRQLERAALTRDSAIGHTLNFTRDANAQDPKKPFWGVTIADEPIDAPQRVAAKANEPAPARREQAETNGVSKPKKQGAALYLEITSFTLDRVVKLYTDAGIPVTMEGVAACVATQFIAANHH